MGEFEIVQLTKRKLEKQGKDVYTDVPFLSRCIDMIIIENNSEIISIEFKIKDWRKAVQQARDHMLGVDKAYICLPVKKRGVSKNLERLLIQYGVGLLFFHEKKKEPLEEIIPAQKSKLIWAKGRSWLKEVLYVN